jgi:eukaryotic-like serine/threonine-protein kinase
MALTPGSKLGPYEIQSPLGAGGMGEVCRARDTRLGRDVAVKILPKALSLDADRLRRFEQEALATAALNHPNILAIFDIGTSDGSPYVVSELLEGETLRDRLRTGPIPMRKALDHALQIAHGLAAAHEKGIIHRDLKPENLFITKDGRVKVLDFGLAKLTQPDSSAHTSLRTMTHVTDIGVVMGTAGYMSPEQVRGVAVDARSDIFSFGALLYEMLSGNRAFRGDTAADTMSAILKEDPPDLTETNRNVSPALDRIVQHCLEKNPESRFHSASDIAFDLEHISGISGSSTKQAAVTSVPSHRKLIIAIASGLIVAAAMLALGWWMGRGTPLVMPEYQQITFRTGRISNARFTPDGSIVYSAAWDNEENQLYLSHVDDPGARELGIKNAELLSISKNGELAIRLNTVTYGGYARSGTMAWVSLSGGTPREVLDNVQDADWASDGEHMAVVRYVPQNSHWRLEYPAGKVLLDGINWLSHPKISPDGKRIAFADHENTGGDDEGSLAVIRADGSDHNQDKKLSSGWTSLQGILWSPSGNEIWFTSTRKGIGNNPRAVTLSGKLRDITNVPGGMWLEDSHDGVVLAVTNHPRLGIRGMATGGKEERELGWFGWSELRDISRDGKKILFEEEADGGGPNYTVFLRDTDGSPPARIGEGVARAISPDGKWVITNPAKGGPLNLVPTGAGESRVLTHDAVSYQNLRYMPDGNHLIAVGIEAGHGARSYLIDVNSGDSKPITPEGTAGVISSPDGRTVAVRGSDGKLGLWPLDGGGFRSIPGLESNYFVIAWTQDGESIYVTPRSQGLKSIPVSTVNIQTGKMVPWKTFGAEAGASGANVSPPRLSSDGNAYAYMYNRLLSEAYVITGIQIGMDRMASSCPSHSLRQ